MRNKYVRSLVLSSLGGAWIAVCSMLSVPGKVPFTLQTFAVYFVLLLFGGKIGLFSVAVYLGLGAFGVPVFSGFRAGVGVLFGTTGGYLLGFLLMAGFYWLTEKKIRGKGWREVTVLVIGSAICYAFGTLWFVTVYAGTTGTVGWFSALSLCVFPFLLPDVFKLILAFYLAKKVRPVLSHR